MKLISKGMSVFKDYVSELYQRSDGTFAVWIIPVNRDPSDPESPRYEPLSGDDWRVWADCHKRHPA